MGLLSSLKNIFSSASTDATNNAKSKSQTHEYKGFSIDTHPAKAEGGYRVSGTIRQDQQEHPFIRADLAYSLEEAHTLTLNKAKQAIDQLGARLFQ